jgi:hypothetical protein
MDIDLGEASRGKDGKLSMKDVQKMKVKHPCFLLVRPEERSMLHAGPLCLYMHRNPVVNLRNRPRDKRAAIRRAEEGFGIRESAVSGLVGNVVECKIHNVGGCRLP